MHLEFMLVMGLDVAVGDAMIQVCILGSQAYPNPLKSVPPNYYLTFTMASVILIVA